MPFNIDLQIIQKTKKWTFEKNERTELLQRLLDKGDREGYAKALIEFSKEENGSHRFTRTKGYVYELLDKGEMIDVPIKFKVKNSVITWSFTAPMDSTHQSFRDVVFNTAAKAHACVGNSCETYYRGTNHYHLIVMHSYAEESDFNHNHYRTANGGPITPVEVYEHLMAFYAQEEGRTIIASEKERDEIILKFAIYWADFNADIRYVALSLMDGEQGEDRLRAQLKEIAKTGKPSPMQARILLEEFFSSAHGKNIMKLAEGKGIIGSDLSSIKTRIIKMYEEAYFQYAPHTASIDSTMEPYPSQMQSQASSSSIGKNSPSRLSPREEYLSAPDQTLDDIDKLEFEAFANDLTKHCQSVNKTLLQDLELEDFRKGLFLYHTLRTAQKVLKINPLKEGDRFHPDLLTHEYIQEMIKQLPFLQSDSTEEVLGGTLLNKLLSWVKTAPKALDEWVDWVKVNGSRGLGSEIALVRLANGKIDLKQAVPQGDRDASQNIAEINFNKVNLDEIFYPNKKSAPKPSFDPDTTKHALKVNLDIYLRDTINNYSSLKNKSDKDHRVFTSKVKIIGHALGALSGKESELKALIERATTDKDWNAVPSPVLKSQLAKYIEEVLDLCASPVKQQDSNVVITNSLL